STPALDEQSSSDHWIVSPRRPVGKDSTASSYHYSSIAALFAHLAAREKEEIVSRPGERVRHDRAWLVPEKALE
ncbi:MAG TPA: hypothetical protein VF099_01590, partial [Ktedonobacterales bacterium]